MYRFAVTLVLCLWTLPAVAGPNKEEPGGYFRLGVGYMNNEGFLASAGLGQRRLFGVSGLETSLEAKITAHQQQLDYRLAVATARMGHHFVELNIYAHAVGLMRDDEALKLHRVGGALSVGWRFAPGWSLSGGLRLEGHSAQNAAQLAGSGLVMPPDHWDETRLYAAPFLRIAYDAGGGVDRDTGLLVGLGLEATVEHSARWAGSAADLTRLEAKARYGLRLPAGMLLQASLRGGVMLGRHGEIPLLSRYRLSGPLAGETALPMFGPAWSANGARLSLGGVGMVHGSLALYAPMVKGMLYGFAGVEAGALYHPDVGGPDFSNMGTGVLGVRWLSPLGPITAGVGLPFSMSKDEKYEPRFLFSFGGSF